MSGAKPAAPGAAPTIDPRDADAVLADLMAARAGYVPEWTPGAGDAGDAGAALATVLARFVAIGISSLDAAPGKAFLAFLQAYGVGLLPPRSARAPLVFTLADGSPIDASVSADSEVAVAVTPTLPVATGAAGSAPSSPVLFSTSESISVVRARLAALQSHLPAADQVAEHAASLTTGFRLFDGLDLVPHELYMGHDTLFALQGSATLTLDISIAPSWPIGATQSAEQASSQASSPGELVWEYLSKDGWIGFDPVEDRSVGLTTDGEVVLHKLAGPDAAQGAIEGVTGYWIRARTHQALPADGAQGLPRIQSIRARVSVDHKQLLPDAAFADRRRLDTSKDFQPFGAQPVLGSTFLLACKEAFSRESAVIGLYLDLDSTAQACAGKVKVTWDYSTGGAWKPLTVADATKDLTTAAAGKDSPAIAFRRPDDWEAASSNGQTAYWLRARITSGGYGGPTAYTVSGGTVSASNVPTPPRITAISIGYRLDTVPFVLGHVLTHNAQTWSDGTAAVRWGNAPFAPFVPLDEPLPGIYLGFDRQLPVGLVSLFVDVPSTGESQEPPALPALGWEYLTQAGWVDLDVLDDTAGFQRSGTIQFVGQPDAAPGPGDPAPLYWVRASFREGLQPEPLEVRAVYLNAVWATQHASVGGEIVGRSDGSARLSFVLQHPPVLAGETIEVQEWRGSGSDWERLQAEVPDDRLRFDRDARGAITAVWVRWLGRTHLFSSGPRDRHYSLERIGGLLQFGDGTAGMIPPPGAAIAASYDHGGGRAGNVAAGTITSPHSPAPFVQAVTNPIPAGGGADAEDADEAGLRGPFALRSLGRALTASDYEWLAREASTEVARSRCLPLTGANGRQSAGRVSVLVVPQSLDGAPMPTQTLLETVRDYLAARCPASVAAQVRIVSPAYLAISVVGAVAVADPGAAAAVEADVRSRLNAFLHPLSGGPGGRGWDFGQPVALSQIVAAAQEVSGVAYVEHFELVVGGLVAGDVVTLEPDQLPVAGAHQIKVRPAVRR